MFSIKEKKKKQYKDDRFSLDAKHTEIVSQFNEDKKGLSKYKKKLHDLQRDYDAMYILDSLDPQKMNERNKLEKDITELKDKINRIENDTDINDYYLKTSPLLFAYYNNNRKKK